MPVHGIDLSFYEETQLVEVSVFRRLFRRIDEVTFSLRRNYVLINHKCKLRPSEAPVLLF